MQIFGLRRLKSYMTSISSKITIAAACAGTALMASVMNANPAQALQFSFTQEGFEYINPDPTAPQDYPPGGILTGSFSGEDLNNDAKLTQNELTSFTLSFTGNPVIPDFKQNLKNVGNLEIDLSLLPASEALRDISTESIVNGNDFEVGGSGTGGTAVTYNPAGGETILYQSNEEVKLAQVPESNNVAGLTGLAVLSLAGFTKKKLLSYW